jgi:hypothetical protein
MGWYFGVDCLRAGLSFLGWEMFIEPSKLE